MASSGSGTITPITPGVPGAGIDTVQEIPYTLLSLPRYARIMGINPAHFMRSSAPSLTTGIFPVDTCGTIWPRYSWQNNDQVSHEELAYAIKEAEEDIAELIGYWPAPVWVSEETHQYPNPYVPMAKGFGNNVKGYIKSLRANYAHFISAGRRAVSLIGTATVAGATLAYSDNDGDGLSETATVTMATTLTDAREIKLYITGMNGMQEWEVRPVRNKTITGGNVVITLDSWLLVDPELLGEYPSDDGFHAIDISTTANFVTSIDVYREYTDFTQASALFGWESYSPTICSSCGGTGCPACGLSTQDGCLQVRDFDNGLLAPVPASYDATSGSWTVATSWTGTAEPDNVKLWYYAGAMDERYKTSVSFDPLSNFWAQTIAWVATARLDRPLCGCGNARDVAEQLSMDVTLNTREVSHFVVPDAMTSPLGTRVGEIKAWRRIKRIVRDRHFGVAVI